MENNNKTKEQLLKEIDQLRAKITELEKSENEHKLAEEALEDSEKKSYSIIHNLMEGFYSATPDGKLLAYNTEFTRILGLDLNKGYVGIELPEFWQDQEDRKDYIEEFKRNGFIKNYIINAKKSDGEKIVVRANSRMIKNREGKPVRIEGTFLDITQQMLAEETLHQYENIVSSSTDMLALLDKQFNYLTANKAYTDAFKLTPEQLIGNMVTNVFGEEFFNTVIKPNADRCLRGEEVNYQDWLNFPAYGRRYMDITYYPYYSEDNKIMGFVVNGRNITGHKLAEERIKHYSRIFEDSLNEIYLFDADTLRFTQVNKAAQNNLGYTIEELQKLTPLDIKPEFTSESFAELVEPLRKGKKKKIVFETVHKRKNQSLYNVEIHLQLLKYEQVALFSAIIMDITERLAAELASKQAEEELQERREENTKLAVIAKERGELQDWINTFDTFVGKFDPNGVGIIFNEAPLKAGGITKDDVVGKYFPDAKWWLHSQIERAKIVECFKQAKAGLSSRIETSFWNMEGTMVPIIFNCQPVMNDGGKVKYITAEGKTIVEETRLRTELQKAKEALEKRVKERTLELIEANIELKKEIVEREQAENHALRQSAVLDAINRVFQESLICETEEEIARTCLAVAEELTESKFGFIGEVNKDGHLDLIAMSDSGWDKCKIQKSDAVVMIKDMEVTGIYGSVIKGGCSLITNNPASHPARVGIPKDHPPITSFLGVPLKRKSKTIGMIALASKEGGYNLADKEYVETLSGAFLEVLIRKRIEEELRKHHEHLEELVKERTTELEEKNKELDKAMKVFVGRELEIRNLQKKISVMEGK